MEIRQEETKGAILGEYNVETNNIPVQVTRKEFKNGILSTPVFVHPFGSASNRSFSVAFLGSTPVLLDSL